MLKSSRFLRLYPRLRKMRSLRRRMLGEQECRMTDKVVNDASPHMRGVQSMRLDRQIRSEGCRFDSGFRFAQIGAGIACGCRSSSTLFTIAITATNISTITTTDTISSCAGSTPDGGVIKSAAYRLSAQWP